MLGLVLVLVLKAAGLLRVGRVCVSCWGRAHQVGSFPLLCACGRERERVRHVERKENWMHGAEWLLLLLWTAVLSSVVADVGVVFQAYMFRHTTHIYVCILRI